MVDWDLVTRQIRKNIEKQTPKIEWEDYNNVQCVGCDTQYEVNVDLDNYEPNFCCFCGSEELIIREEEVL